MVDAAYYRRQAATCREVAGRFRWPERLLDLAAYFDRRAAQSEEWSEASATAGWPGAGARRMKPVRPIAAQAARATAPPVKTRLD